VPNFTIVLDFGVGAGFVFDIRHYPRESIEMRPGRLPGFDMTVFWGRREGL
jgi:hypothetical protein